MRTISTGPSPAHSPLKSELWRLVVAHLLRCASAALARRARAVARPLHARQRRGEDVPPVEFDDDGQAQHGALYVDGIFIGYIACRRL